MDRQTILPHEIERKLIESIYGVTIDLDKYSDLLLLWEEEFLRSDQLAGAAMPHVESHVNTASNIMEMTHLLKEVAQTLEEMVAAHKLPIFILDQDCKVIFANDIAGEFFDLEIGTPLKAATFAKNDMSKVEYYLGVLNDLKTDEILAIIQAHDEDGDATLLFSVSKIFDAKTSNHYLQISAVNIAWNYNVGAVIQDSFSLSDVELDLARRYVAGERLVDIAASKNRSVNTLKVQTKSLYRKTKLNSQSELVRLFSALQSFSLPEVDELENTDETLFTKNSHKVIERPNGRKLYYEIYGDPNGEPVLFMHDILLGTHLSKNIIGCLYAQKIKLIAPHRAGYGYSGNYAGKDRLDSFVEDMQAILTAEKVKNFKIISQYLGSVYAFYLANAMPKRVLKMRLINAYAPISNKTQMADIPMPIKVLVYTIKYMPHLYPFFMRIMTAQVKKLGAPYVTKQYFKDSEFDLELCDDPEIAEIIAESFHCCFGAGAQGPTQTSTDAIQYDWLRLMRKCKIDVEYYHGTESFSPLHLIKDIVEWQKNAHLEVFDGGQLILYKYPKKILKNL